jgi:AcrR family transcriptional regulator
MPIAPVTMRGVATTQRILDAASVEFGARGLAGARIDRIAETANANKAQIYAYFHSKEGLFDAVIAERADRTTDALPFDASDLPGWAVRIYDGNLERPELVRLIAWTRLERRPTGAWFDDDRHKPKVDAVRAAQARGEIRAGDPNDILVLVISMASAWSPASPVYTATSDEPASEHDRRRELLRDTVARAIAP